MTLGQKKETHPTWDMLSSSLAKIVECLAVYVNTHLEVLSFIGSL